MTTEENKSDQVNPADAVAPQDDGQGHPGVVARWRGRGQRGMITAEYAVGTVAAISVVTVLITIFKDPEFLELLWKIIKWLIELIMQAL